MKKKGDFSEIGKWLVGLLIVVVILAILFGPKKLFAKVRDGILTFGAGQLPEEESPEFSSISRIPSEIESYFDNIVSKIKDSGTKKDCRIEIGQAPKMKDFSITFYENKIELGRKDKRVKTLYEKTPYEKSEIIEGFKPCYVKETAEKFYDCTIIQPVRCEGEYTSGSFSIDDENSNIAPFLFKFDINHMCIIYIDSFNFDLGRCTKTTDSVNDECISNIRNNYLICK